MSIYMTTLSTTGRKNFYDMAETLELAANCGISRARRMTTLRKSPKFMGQRQALRKKSPALRTGFPAGRGAAIR
ncbi:MAG: hypothetical protein QM741_12830 [Rudaea sp.]|uniref:hypothetical protein n=1 Tax=Rudaea sp. TaxID=2136325 RepID=UPI0039E42EB6